MLWSRGRKYRAAWSGLWAVVVALPPVGCARPPAPIAQLPVPEVTVEKPVLKELQETYETTGRIAAVEMVQVLPRVSGHIIEVSFKDGQKVQAGDTLFKIDPRPFEAALAQARAQVDLEQASVLKTAADLARQQDLFNKKVATKQDFDLAVAERDSATARKAQAEAKVSSAELDLEFATIKAPIAGKIGASTVKVGSLVGGTVVSTTPLTTIVSTKPIHAYYSIDERTVLRIRESLVATGRGAELGGAEIRKANMEVTVTVENADIKPMVGILDFVDNRVDPQTGTIRGRVELPNDPEFLTEGMFVRVSMPVGKPRPGLMVPERAIQTNLGTKFVFVVGEDNKARAVPVLPGLKRGALVECVTETDAQQKLSPDSEVITAGLQRVREGAPVKIAPPAPAAGTAPEHKVGAAVIGAASGGA